MDAYRAGFLHRDFSPGNVIITVDGKGLLIDWDLSKLLAGKSETPRRATRTVRAKFQLFVFWFRLTLLSRVPGNLCPPD